MPRLVPLPLAALCLLGTATVFAPAFAGGIGLDDMGRYTAPLSGAPAIANDTPYSNALRCLLPETASRPVRVAVGKIADDSGRGSGAGLWITDGASLMAISALAKAGVSQVERTDMSIAALDRKLAGGDGEQRAVPASEYYLVGGITEVNTGLDKEPGGSVMNIALDMRLVDTATLRIVDVVSYQKQIVTERDSRWAAREPVQLAIRATIERGVLEMLTRLYRVPTSSCSSGAERQDAALPDSNDTRAVPYRFFRRREAAAEPRLRRRFQ